MTAGSAKVTGLQPLLLGIRIQNVLAAYRDSGPGWEFRTRRSRGAEETNSHQKEVQDNVSCKVRLVNG